MRIDVKNGERLILRTRPSAVILRSAVIWALLLAVILGFGAGAFHVLMNQQLLEPSFYTYLGYAYYVAWALVFLLLIYPGVLRPLLRYARHRTWLTNQRLVHRRYFPTMSTHAGRRPAGSRTVTIALGSITDLRYGKSRANSADIWVHYGFGEAVRLPQIPQPALFVESVWVEVSKTTQRTNVEAERSAPGTRWD